VNGRHYEMIGRVRKWGLPVWRAFEYEDPPAIAAVVDPTVNVTVVYVQPGAHVSIGGVIVSAATPVPDMAGRDILPGTIVRAAIETDDKEGTHP
jgi:hypothetical protein